LNGNKLKYLFVVAFLCSQLAIFGQIVRKIDGEKFQVHIVEKGHTLFAISKKYSVKIDEIVKHNPGVRAGLKIGEEVLIPLGEVDKKEARDNPPDMRGEYLYHTVEKKETLYSISKKHGVEIAQILEHNPEAKKGLKIGQELKIFVGDVEVNDPEIIAPAKEDSLVMHKVEPGQTLFSISQFYQVSIDSIETLNGGLEEGLKAGGYIRIPQYTKAFLAKRDTIREEPQFPIIKGTRKKYNVALMLPFSMEVQDSLFANSDPTKSLDLYTLTRISAEMYRGVMLAIDSLVDQGLTLDLHVYDVTDDLMELEDLLRKPELKKMHLILGPLHRESFERVSRYAGEHGMRVVAPVPNQKLIPKFAGSCVVHTNSMQQMKFIGKYVARMHFTDNVVVVDSDKFKDYDYVQTFLSTYQDHFRFGDTLRATKLNEYGIESVRNQLSKSQKNIVVVPSSDLGFVSDFMNRLSNINEKDYDIQVIGMEKWLDYHNIDTEYKNRFNLTVPSSTFLDFEKPQTEKFIEAYRAKYDQDHGSDGYSFLGFDVAYYFLGGLMKYGLDFANHFSEMPEDGIHLGFQFEQESNGCFNRHVYLLQFEDYNLKQLN